MRDCESGMGGVALEAGRVQPRERRGPAKGKAQEATAVVLSRPVGDKESALSPLDSHPLSSRV